MSTIKVITVTEAQNLSDLQNIVNTVIKNAPGKPQHIFMLEDNKKNKLRLVVSDKAMSQKDVADYLKQVYGSTLNYKIDPKLDRDAPVWFTVSGNTVLSGTIINKPDILLVDYNLRPIETRRQTSQKTSRKKDIGVAPALLKFMGINPNDRGARQG